MFLRVVPPLKNKIDNLEQNSVFFLEQDNWNDFSFQTFYHLHISGEYTKDGKSALIGSVKILKKGQTKNDGLQLEVGELDPLDETFCSLGQSLDYYERIANLEDDIKYKILEFLQDIVIFPAKKEGFEKEDGWNTSLFRDINEDDDIFEIAPAIFSKEFDKIADIDLEFNFNSENLIEPIKFSFNSPTYGWLDDLSLPGRIIVLIGRNGSGKSTILSKISKIAFASTQDRRDEILKKVGEFSPSGLGFLKILNISYSAFDSFHVPGIYIHEKEQIAKDIINGSGRYIFCGVRDIAAELTTIIDTIETDGRGKLTEQEILNDKQTSTILKPIDSLAKEFTETLFKIKDNKEKEALFIRALNIIKQEPSFSNIKKEVREINTKEEAHKYFIIKSTGHKFTLHSLVHIIFHTEKRTLVLFDEPEIHLHPPLLAVLMRAIRHVLKEVDAFLVVATHSPVVVQETLSKHVNIIRKEGQNIKALKPEIQTFGENIGTITNHIFGLSSEVTDFHTELDSVVKNINLFGTDDIEKKLEKIEKLFENDISMQSRAYIQTKLLELEDE